MLPEIVRTVISRLAQTVRGDTKARRPPLFLGFEHCGLYPLRTNAKILVSWYRDTFGFELTEENASYFLSGAGAGRLEIMKNISGEAHVHIAIHVSDFEEAAAALRAKNVRMREPILQPDLKIVYLEDPDPEGNPVHLWWSVK